MTAITEVLPCNDGEDACAEPPQEDTTTSVPTTAPQNPPLANPADAEAYGETEQTADCPGLDGPVPFAPLTKKPVCPPYQRPAVFFSPHPDDESLSMGGAIAEHVAAGRAVFVELLTHGDKSGILTVLGNGKSCDWHEGTHQYALSVEAFGMARVQEFLAATARLGVTGVVISDFGDQNLTPSEVESRISWWLRNGGEGLSLKGTAGGMDDQSKTGVPAHVDHTALAEALRRSGHNDLRLYLSYYAQSGLGTFDATIDLTAKGFCDEKRAALAEYGRWAPAAGRYAIGKHSMGTLLTAVSEACKEYIQKVATPAQ
ncbi:MAG: hypothetical protein A2284_12420 [Deltaproteobacteria bacterium RIFOXYA12_FULL_61_11]|nr:MAG: hypothetical protein A2284_12420 [Deltaproteobacteria bacterium RIFOXYA12_FULL_61_11]